MIVVSFFTACKGDINTELKGKTFEYSNGLYGSNRIWSSYKFERSGNVYHESQVGNAPKFDTKGCALYYTLEDKTLTIYHGSRGWKKEVRNTVYASGEYFDDYLVIDGLRYMLQ
ncbi:MAG: hypothetical protein K2N34_14165 [Lachnospiraceae bacterium]|nr:hypothetical protein [Lachnospiraceae bacterium]